METGIIVLYENNNLIIQFASIITTGFYKVVKRNHPEQSVFSNKITNTDFIREAINIAPGKYLVQINTEFEQITKSITIN